MDDPGSIDIAVLSPQSNNTPTGMLGPTSHPLSSGKLAAAAVIIGNLSSILKGVKDIFEILNLRADAITVPPSAVWPLRIVLFGGYAIAGWYVIAMLPRWWSTDRLLLKRIGVGAAVLFVLYVNVEALNSFEESL